MPASSGSNPNQAKEALSSLLYRSQAFARKFLRVLPPNKHNSLLYIGFELALLFQIAFFQTRIRSASLRTSLHRLLLLFEPFYFYLFTYLCILHKSVIHYTNRYTNERVNSKKISVIRRSLFSVRSPKDCHKGH